MRAEAVKLRKAKLLALRPPEGGQRSRAEARTSVLAEGQNLEIDRIHSGQFESKQRGPRRSGGPAGEQINYEELLPAQPEEDVVAFACQKGAFQNNYLIYRSEWIRKPLDDQKKEEVRVTCSACGEHFYADKIKAGGCGHSCAPAPFGWRNWNPVDDIISGQHTLCPLCGAEAETVHVSGMRLYGGELVEEYFVTILYRLPVEGRTDRLAVTDWCIRRCINKEGQTRYEVWPYTAWVVEERKIIRLMGYAKCMGSISLFGQWKQRKTFAECNGGTGMVMPWKRSLLNGTTAENCKLDLYQKAGGKLLVAYLALWRKRPAVENLLVQGCGKLVAKWIVREKETYPYGGGIPKLPAVNWKEKRPAQMLGLNREEFRHLRQMKWTAEDLEKYKMVRDADIPIKLQAGEMNFLRSIQTYNCNRILEEAPKADFWRILRYLVKQGADWSALRDYWRMAREDGRDLEDSLVRWPRDLKASHNEQIRERQAIEARKEAAKRAEQIAARAPLFLARAEALDKLSFARDGLLIRPCANEEELIAEGKLLHHCVAGYARDHANGKTAILFVRRADKPEEPYYTLEFDEKNLTVRQNRGLRNCGRTPEVEAFEKAWLEWVKARAKKKARVKAA